MGPAILIMAFTSLLCFVIVYKLVKARQAMHWPSVEGLILKSGTRLRESDSGDSNEAETLAALRYQYEVAGQTYRNQQIRAGDRFGMVPGAEILSRFPKGAKVPVFYNPSNPKEAVLETRLPYSVRGAWAGAAITFMAGAAVSLIFLNLDKEMVKLRAMFPPGAEPQFVIFFGLCALWTAFMIWDNWHQAHLAKGWPVAEGVIISSRTEGHKARASSSGQGPHVTLYYPVVEYSYLVGGITYYSARVSFGADVSTKAKDSAAARAARYAAGAKVDVHYNPRHPSVAVLETGVAFQGLTILLLILFIGGALFFSGLRP